MGLSEERKFDFLKRIRQIPEAGVDGCRINDKIESLSDGKLRLTAAGEKVVL